MNVREQDLKTISNEFAVWKNRLSLLGSINLQDANIISEHLILEILNVVLDYNLINANSLRNNFPAIDLIDKKSRIAFQVTSTTSSKKVQSTIHSFTGHELYKSFDELYILILGDKQKKYSLVIPTEINFTPAKNIIDLSDLFRLISFQKTDKISNIKKIILTENKFPRSKTKKITESRIKRNLALKKKLQKDFLLEIPRDKWQYAFYEPWIRFRYHNAILRDPNDKTYPEVGNNNHWLKVEFWDFYDRGIEFISQGGEAIFDKDGYWDLLQFKDDRRNNPEYEIQGYWVYARLAFDNIAAHDMEPDDYEGLPTIYCSFSFDGFPYEEVLFGGIGTYELKCWRNLFDNKMRKTSDW